MTLYSLSIGPHVIKKASQEKQGNYESRQDYITALNTNKLKNPIRYQKFDLCPNFW